MRLLPIALVCAVSSCRCNDPQPAPPDVATEAPTTQPPSPPPEDVDVTWRSVEFIRTMDALVGKWGKEGVPPWAFLETQVSKRDGIVVEPYGYRLELRTADDLYICSFFHADFSLAYCEQGVGAGERMGDERVITPILLEYGETPGLLHLRVKIGKDKSVMVIRDAP